jgi:hypothetical protein
LIEDTFSFYFPPQNYVLRKFKSFEVVLFVALVVLCQGSADPFENGDTVPWVGSLTGQQNGEEHLRFSMTQLVQGKIEAFKHTQFATTGKFRCVLKPFPYLSDLPSL